MSNGINNSNKNSTTNGFNHNNNNNNNGNTSTAAPAADRYAALKDLDEQLRESKAVAAQAASIVTANVVESGFGNRKFLFFCKYLLYSWDFVFVIFMKLLTSPSCCNF